MNNTELKPCPFCGGEAVYTDNYNGDGTGHCVYCTECGSGAAILTGATPPEELKARVCAYWNRRAENDT